MADYGTLFSLVLVALTFVLVGICFMVYIMILGEREKRRLRTSESGSAENIPERECPHFFGYLSGYPKSESVPDECFGCAQANECMSAKSEKNPAAQVAEQS
jgi:hypothetical protein